MASRKDKKGRVFRKGEGYSDTKEMYYYSYSDPLGKRKYLYSKDLLSLREKEEQLKKDQLDGIDLYLAGRADLNFMFDRYMATKTDLRVSTKANYIDTYDRYVREDFGRKKLNDIRYSDILFFYQQLIKDKNLHMGTIQYIQRVIHPSFEMAVRDNIIRTNPAHGVMKQLKAKSEVAKDYKRHALTLEQQRAFLSYLEEEACYQKWKPMFVVLVGTGCRIGELIGLRWDDVDFDRRVININHSMYYFAGKKNKKPGKWLVNLPKTDAGIREIPMLDPVYAAFLEEKSRQEDEGIYCVSEVNGMSGFIFCNRFLTIHNPESVNKQLDRVIAKYNSDEEIKAAREKRDPIYLPNFSCHHLRHTFCTRLCEADVNIKVIQTIMGHKDIQTTMDIYAEVTGDKKKKSLEEIFNQMQLF